MEERAVEATPDESVSVLRARSSRSEPPGDGQDAWVEAQDAIRRNSSELPPSWHRLLKFARAQPRRISIPVVASLGKHLRGMVEWGETCADAVLHAREGEPLYVYTPLLSDSTFLWKLLRAGNFREARHRQAQIPNLCLRVLRAVVAAVYEGDAHPSELASSLGFAELLELLRFADYAGMNFLVSAACDAICWRLGPRRVRVEHVVLALEAVSGPVATATCSAMEQILGAAARSVPYFVRNGALAAPRHDLGARVAREVWARALAKVVATSSVGLGARGRICRLPGVHFQSWIELALGQFPPAPSSPTPSLEDFCTRHAHQAVEEFCAAWEEDLQQMEERAANAAHDLTRDYLRLSEAAALSLQAHNQCTFEYGGQEQHKTPLLIALMSLGAFPDPPPSEARRLALCEQMLLRQRKYIRLERQRLMALRATHAPLCD